MRFFIALEIAESCLQSLTSVQKDLQQIIPDIKLTDNDKLHLTIAFIGESSETKIPQFTKIIQDAVLGIPPFSIIPAYIDAFPELHHPHTFWVGIKGDIDKLFVIRERIKDGITKLGFDTDERRYIPHIAIGKVNSPYVLSGHQEAELQKMSINEDFANINITSIKLFESISEEPARNASASVAGGGFHRHNTLAEIPLVNL